MGSRLTGGPAQEQQGDIHLVEQVRERRRYTPSVGCRIRPSRPILNNKAKSEKLDEFLKDEVFQRPPRISSGD
jgi:hypothetical protein